MEKKKFHCKIKDLPIIGRFLLISYQQDKPLFVRYSTIFDAEYEDTLNEKITACSEMFETTELLLLQKRVTKNIGKSIKNLRAKLNTIEGYVKLANNLDVQQSDFGLQKVRKGISDKNPEVVMSGLRALIACLLHNTDQLSAVGYSSALTEELTAHMNELIALNEEQNVLKNKRSRSANHVMKAHNALWEQMTLLLYAGKAIFRAVDDVKLREYSFTRLKKRVEGTSRAKSN